MKETNSRESAGEETRRRFSHLNGQVIQIWTTHHLHILPPGIEPIAAEFKGVFREIIGAGTHYMVRLAFESGEETLIPVSTIWRIETIGYIEQEKERMAEEPSVRELGRPQKYSTADIERFLSTEQSTMLLDAYRNYKKEVGRTNAMSEGTWRKFWQELSDMGRIKEERKFFWVLVPDGA